MTSDRLIDLVRAAKFVKNIYEREIVACDLNSSISAVATLNNNLIIRDSNRNILRHIHLNETINNLSFSKDGKHLLCDTNSRLIVYSCNNWNVVNQIYSAYGRSFFSHDNNVIVSYQNSLSNMVNINFVVLDKSKTYTDFKHCLSKYKIIDHVSLSQDNRYIVLYIKFENDSMEQILIYSIVDCNFYILPLKNKFKNNDVKNICCFRKDNLLVIASIMNSNELRMYTWEPKSNLTQNKYHVKATNKIIDIKDFKFSRDGKYLVYSFHTKKNKRCKRYNHCIAIVDIETWKLINEYQVLVNESHLSYIKDYFISADSNYLVIIVTNYIKDGNRMRSKIRLVKL